jgi:hypothetical protein
MEVSREWSFVATNQGDPHVTEAGRVKGFFCSLQKTAQFPSALELPDSRTVSE